MLKRFTLFCFLETLKNAVLHFDQCKQYFVHLSLFLLLCFV